MFYTYILQSNKDKQFYTGYTDDLQKRVKEHGDGKVASTKKGIPSQLAQRLSILLSNFWGFETFQVRKILEKIPSRILTSLQR